MRCSPLAGLAASLLVALPNVLIAQIAPIEFTPTALASGNNSFFTVAPTANPALYFGRDYGIRLKRVNFNTAPDGPLSEGGSVNTQYASLGVTMNDIRLSADIYGGNNYGAGFAAEDDVPQIYTFSKPVVAVGIVNTSPDKDLIQFYSGPNATGSLLFSFRDQENLSTNFTIDRFVGGMVTGGPKIGSFVIQNQSGNLELDELIFAVDAKPGDTDLDDDVDFNDLLALARNYGILNGRRWEHGDFDFNGSTNFDDLLTLARNYGTTAAVFESDWAAAQASVVPEPVLAPLLIIAGLAGRRRG